MPRRSSVVIWKYSWLSLKSCSWGSGALKEQRSVLSPFNMCLSDPSCSHKIAESVRISTKTEEKQKIFTTYILAYFANLESVKVL